MSALTRHFYLIRNAEAIQPLRNRELLVAELKLLSPMTVGFYDLTSQIIITFYGTEMAAGKIQEHFPELLLQMGVSPKSFISKKEVIREDVGPQLGRLENDIEFEDWI